MSSEKGCFSYKHHNQRSHSLYFKRKLKGLCNIFCTHVFSSGGISPSSDDSPGAEPLFLRRKDSRALRRRSLSTSSASSMLLWAVSLERKEDYISLRVQAGLNTFICQPCHDLWDFIIFPIILFIPKQHIYRTTWAGSKDRNKKTSLAFSPNIQSEMFTPVLDFSNQKYCLYFSVLLMCQIKRREFFQQ